MILATSNCVDLGCIGVGIGAVTTFAITMPLAVSAGIYGGGTLHDGNGGFGWTFWGTVLGAVAGAGITWGVAAASEDPVPFVFPASMAILSITGGVLGFELSDTDPTEALASERRRYLVPVVTPTHAGSGVLVGVGGTF